MHDLDFTVLTQKYSLPYWQSAFCVKGKSVGLVHIHHSTHGGLGVLVFCKFHQLLHQNKTWNKGSNLFGQISKRSVIWHVGNKAWLFCATDTHFILNKASNISVLPIFTLEREIAVFLSLEVFPYRVTVFLLVCEISLVTLFTRQAVPTHCTRIITLEKNPLKDCT